MKSKDDFKSIGDYREYLKFYFATMAMQGLLSNPSQIGATTDFEWATIHAIGYADKLLKQLEN